MCYFHRFVILVYPTPCEIQCGHPYPEARDTPTDAIGYKRNSICNLVVLPRIGQKLSSVSAIDIPRSRCSGIQRVVGRIGYYLTVPSDLRRSSLELKICKSLNLFVLAKTYIFLKINKNTNTFIRNTFPLPEIIYDESLIF